MLHLSASSHVGNNKSIIILSAQIIDREISKTPQKKKFCGEEAYLKKSSLLRGQHGMRQMVGSFNIYRSWSDVFQIIH